MSDNACCIRDATAEDAGALARIYNHHVAETVVTFEEEAVSAAEMARRIGDIQGVPLPWLVAESGGEVKGFAHASQWKGRCAYRYSAEVTVYLDPDCRGRGFDAATAAAGNCRLLQCKSCILLLSWGRFSRPMEK